MKYSCTNIFHRHSLYTFYTKAISKLEQLERLLSEDNPRRPMITHTIDQFIMNPKSILMTTLYRIPSQNKVKAKKLEKLEFF